ncbi:MAG: DUF4432 family protein [Brachybacterium tyrofermentans]|uniref:DUF4432 family protein n=1 Tax=Brachybacterium tyrofermentans TaxID=47848 RepID=UPI001867A7E2|nr:DUF4432 family protein [Brachybacterium tyrofermentans]
MAFTLDLPRELFGETPRVVCQSPEWTVSARRCRTGVESLSIRNSRGRVEVLPFLGQIVWDAEFDGQSLRMTSMFEEPRKVERIAETYGCFAFHSGLLAAGCPSPEDDHPLHGEFSCAEMDSAELVLAEDSVTIRSVHEYVMGFGHHYRAIPSVTLRAGSALLDIDLEVTNLSAYATMPLQYICHLNYRFLEGARMTQTLPEGTFHLRESIPAHVAPTPAWEQITQRIRSGAIDPDSLVGAEQFDPEIVYFADDLPAQGGPLRFSLANSDEFEFVTEFDSSQFPTATRWILSNPDQQVAAFALPATSRPEGFLAAERAGTLVQLPAGRSTRFSVTTGLVAAAEKESH